MSIIAYYNGASGMRAYQNALDVVSHNIANVNTVGYKVQRASFEDLIRTQLDTRVQGSNLVGHGVKQEDIKAIFSQNGLNPTNYPLDFGIAGDGFFMVEKNGETEFTRNGSFNISVEGNSAFLVTDDGAYVLDRARNRIALEPGTGGGYSTENLTGRIGVYTFPNLFALEQRSGARFVPNERSGQAMLMGAGGASTKDMELYQGVLEFSAVDLAQQMTELITAQRGFQMNSRVLQTADQLAQEINSLR